MKHFITQALLSIALSLTLVPDGWSLGRPEPILRTEGPMVSLRLNRKHTLMAFTDQHGQSLRIMDLETHEITEVTPHRVGEAFFWSPDGSRLFYRQLLLEKGQIVSELNAFDTTLNTNITLDSIAGSSGYLTFDPRDYSLYMMHEKGILSRRLNFPGDRLAAWQKRAKVDDGRFIATQKSVLWISDLGLTLAALADDGSGVESFDIAPDGKLIAWATRDAKVYVSVLGAPARLIGRGRDPRWHPVKSLLLYASARTIGSKVYDYDIRMTDLNGEGRFLMTTPQQAERWPQWWGEDGVIYANDGSTDLWRINYRDELAKAPESAPTERQ